MASAIPSKAMVSSKPGIPFVSEGVAFFTASSVVSGAGVAVGVGAGAVGAGVGVWTGVGVGVADAGADDDDVVRFVSSTSPPRYSGFMGNGFPSRAMIAQTVMYPGLDV